MPQLRQITAAIRPKAAADGLGELVGRQFGVLSRRQLAGFGVEGSRLTRWLAQGRLHRIHPHVYAIGHTALSLQGRLWAALLYAGPEAALSHTTAAWLWSLIDAEPNRIHVTVPGRRRSLPDVRVHHSRRCAALHCQGFRVTPAVRTLVDLGPVLTARQLRRALAEADYHGLLDRGELDAELGLRRQGSKALRAALRRHLPALTRTLSVLEERFVELCEDGGLEPPEVNAEVRRMRVDALWREQRVAAELDGAAAHGGWAAIKRDRQRELALRAAGYRVVRYTWEQVNGQPDEVAADLRRLLDG